jgi:hypothetical protein
MMCARRDRTGKRLAGLVDGCFDELTGERNLMATNMSYYILRSFVARSLESWYWSCLR